MFSPDQYELIDFGEGRKLESFAAQILDRPCPAADGIPKSQPDRWQDAATRFRKSGQTGRWQPAAALPDSWCIRHDSQKLTLKPTSFGHVGVFPEQAENWDWARARAESRKGLKVLNLFAYTGGATLALAAAGAHVTHVDAARNVVNWARRNAEQSGMESAPIRWIAEDASRFVQRELKRGHGYDAVVLDPPTYGHGPKGEIWKLTEHLPDLLSACGELTNGRRAFLLLSCHSPGYGPAELEALLAETIYGHCRGGAAATELVLRDQQGRALNCGTCARCRG